jgi:hypothetical protein
LRGFDDSAWSRGASGLGYETSGNEYDGLIATNLVGAVRNGSFSLRTRFTFDAPEAAAITGLTLRLKYDDGFVAWLNGVEVARANAAAGVPAWNTAATAQHPDPDSATYEIYDLTPFIGSLEDSANVLAVQVMNETIGSSDILVLPEITASRNVRVELIASGADAVALIPQNGALGNTWTGPGFSPAGWRSGTTGIGYERSSGYQGLIGLDIPEMYNSRTSCYIRVPFMVDDPAVLNSLLLRMKYDDAYVAYINGVEVARSSNAPADNGWDSAAVTIHDDGDAVVFEDMEISSALQQLISGENVLAIHGMNDSRTSSDFLILPELLATRPPVIRSAYDDWIGGGAVSDPSPDADPDGDGATSGDEYAHGTNPAVPDRNARELHTSMLAGGTVQLRFRVVAGRSYQMQYSDDLSGWRNVGEAWDQESDTDSYLWGDDGSLAGGEPIGILPRFYRLRVAIQ